MAKWTVFLFFVVGMFGFVLPAMISANDSMVATFGLVLIPLVLWAGYIFIKTQQKGIKKLMKKLNSLLMLLMVLLLASCSKVPAGNVGVKVYLLGGDKGVDTEELGVGRYWIGWNEELYLFPTFTQNTVWTKSPTEGSENDESITFQTSEGLTVNGDVGISYAIDPAYVNKVFQKYRKGIAEITDIYIRNMVRDAFNTVSSKYTVEYVYGQGKSDMLQEVEDMVRSQVADIGIKIEKVYIIGSLRLPKTVITALNLKIEAKQRAEQRENELREAEAQAKKRIAEAEGEAHAMLAMAEAEAKALRLKRLEINDQLVRYESIQKWNGTLPGVTGGVVPFLDIKTR